MKVHFRQTGGFGGLVLGSDLDTSTLPPAEGQELTRLVGQANLEKLKSRPSDKARDLQNYEIIVEGGGLNTKASFDDMNVDANLEPLLEFLRKRARAVPLDG
ncbi:MAG: protealysin inhibitor emfourin [Candidatus Binatia bacterium]